MVAEILDEAWLARSDQDSGRSGEALGHIRRAAAVGEGWVRSHPESANTYGKLGHAWLQVAFIEASLGLDQEALRDARHVSESLEPIIRANPRDRFARGDICAALLIEAIASLRSGSPGEAARDADRAASSLEAMPPPLRWREPLYLGSAHALFYAAGRPAGPGRPAEPPGLSRHAERAIAGFVEADRLGYRLPVALAVVDQLLGGRPELQLLLMDQLFPADPFQPDASGAVNGQVP